MAKEEKKPSEEKAKDFPPAEAEKKKEAPADTEKDKSDSENPPAESAQDKPDKAQADEGGKTPVEAEKPSETGAEKPAEADGKPPAEQSSESAEPDSAEANQSPAAEVPVQNTELLEVTAQLAAYKSGVRGDVVEDAVCLAVHDAQKAGELTEKTVSKALAGVLERHPEWKNTAENAAGFRVGADGSQKPPASNDAIAQIFGNK